MEELRQQVGRARWWLGVQRFVRALGWCLFATLLVAAILITIDKFWSLGIEPWGWGAGAVVLGLLAAIIWAVVKDRGPIDAAIEIDRRFGLKERVSSSLALSEEERQSEAGMAVLEDTRRRVQRIELSEQFGVAPGRQVLLPLVPALAAVLVFFFVPAATDNSAQGNTEPETVRKQIEKSQQSLQIKLQDKRQQAKQQGLKDAQDLFLKLEKELGEASKLQGDKNDALAKLHDLAEKLEKRRQELGGSDTIEKQLEQLKNIGQGPADKMLQALAKGDMKVAKQELEKLKADLANGKLNDQQRQALAKQLNEMQKKLQNLADAHKKAQEDLKQQIEQARKAGQDAQADKLQEQLRKLQQQMPQMDQLQQLANKLGQCGKCVEGGQQAEAAKMLEQMAGDMQALEQGMEELKMLKEAMDELDEARKRMLCPKCGGVGCEFCQGDIPGDGLGAGRGQGARPIADDDVDFRNTRTPPKVGKGAMTIEGEVDGPAAKGNVQQKFIEMEKSARSQEADPLSEQRMSRKHRQHAQEYFDRFRGEPAKDR